MKTISDEAVDATTTTSSGGGRPLKKPDRRILRTQGVLRLAMIELIIEKGYGAISISEITERANVGRSTFYAHFADKDDLLQGSVEILRAHLQVAIDERSSDEGSTSHPALEFCLPMLEHAHEHRGLLSAMLVGNGGQLMTELIHEMWASFIKSKWPQGEELEVQALVGAFGHVILWWLTHEPEATPKAIEKRFVDFAAGVLSK